jgi:hypothetical protein
MDMRGSWRGAAGLQELGLFGFRFSKNRKNIDADAGF